MKRIREFAEDAAFCVCGCLLVLGLCALYWLCRLFGIDLGDDF